MKRELKGFIVGSITTAILMTGIVGFAEGAWKTIDVAMNSVKINVNGKEVKGNNFIYDETTYVPLRSISDGFNKEITWDNDTRTVNINDKVGTEKPLPVPIKDITKVDSKVEVKSSDKVINSNSVEIIEIKQQEFVKEGNKIFNKCIFSDGYVVCLTIPKNTILNKEYVDIFVGDLGRDISNKNINIVGFNDKLNEKYNPLSFNDYVKDAPSRDFNFFKEKDFYEKIKVLNNQVHGLVFYNSGTNLEGIMFDDGIHKCKLYLQDK